MYVKTANGMALVYPYSTNEFRADNPQVSFPSAINDAMLAEYDVYPVVIEPNPPYDPATQYIQASNLPALIDGVWVQTKTVVDMTPAQIQAREDRLKGDNKQKAEHLLSETDWVEIPSVSNTANTPHLVNYADFIAYRLGLRAIAVNPPITVSAWPVKPQEVWSSD